MNERADIEAQRVVATLEPKEAAMRLAVERRVIFHRLTNKPTYQCERGHVYELANNYLPQCCGRCGSSIIDKCVNCGTSLLLEKTYSPPYPQVNSREMCLACYSLYPWTLHYLFRPSESTELNPYEIKLLVHAPDSPNRSYYDDEKLKLEKEISISPANTIHKLFGLGVGVSDSRHPKHGLWAAIDEKYNVALSKYTQQVIGYRKAKLDSALALTHGHDYWRTLSGTEFEEMLAVLLRRRGFIVHRVGGPGDKGVDLIVEKNGARIIVQCKAFSKAVGPGPVRDIYGALLHHAADEAWLVSLEGFSKAAIHFAANKPIRLLPITTFLSK